MRSLRKNANNFIRFPEQLKTYCGAKFFNTLPNDIREAQDKMDSKGLDVEEKSHHIRQMFSLSDHLLFQII